MDAKPYTIPYNGRMRLQEHHLTEYRRHHPPCEFTKPSKLLKCNCPLWAQGRIHGKYVRRSLGTRNLERAQAVIRALLDAQAEPLTLASITDAIEDYLRYCEFHRGLDTRTLENRRTTLKDFKAFCTNRSGLPTRVRLKRYRR